MNKLLLATVVLAISVFSTDIAKAASEASPMAFTLPVLPLTNNHKEVRKISLQDFRGQLVYVDFWASWCGPCAVSMPFLNNLRERYKAQGFEVIAVNVDEDITRAREFLQRMEIDYPVVFDKNQSLMASLDIQGLPTAFLIDEHGKVILQHQGFKSTDKEYLNAVIDKELARIAFEK